MDVLGVQPRWSVFSLSLFCCCGLQLKEDKVKTERTGRKESRRGRGRKGDVREGRERPTGACGKETGVGAEMRRGGNAQRCNCFQFVCLLNILIHNAIIWLHLLEMLSDCCWLLLASTQREIELQWACLSVSVTEDQGGRAVKRKRREWGTGRFSVEYVKSHDFMLHASVPLPALSAPLFPWSQAVYN